MIPKEKIVPGKNLTKKQLRPIGEADAISKYGPIKIFMSQLREKLIPILNKNQYAFPEKGCPQANIHLLDTVNSHIHHGRKVLIAIYDFSHCFGTFCHKLCIILPKNTTCRRE